MHYNVPQFIDIEDTIVGPLTAKQMLWLFAMAGVLFIVWFISGNNTIFFIVGAPIAILFLALAFYKPHGQPFISFIMHAVLFIVRPKIYIWKREEIEKKSIKVNKKDNKEKNIKRKNIKQEEIIELAKLLDSESDILRK